MARGSGLVAGLLALAVAATAESAASSCAARAMLQSHIGVFFLNQDLSEIKEGDEGSAIVSDGEEDDEVGSGALEGTGVSLGEGAGSAETAAVGVHEAAAEEEQREAAQAHLREQAQAYQEHVDRLTRAIESMHASQAPANTAIDQLIAQFINHQAASQDKCPAQLLEAKTQLNQLHSLIHELAWDINVTEMSLTTTMVQISTANTEIKETEERKNIELQKCEKKEEQDKRMYNIIIHELHEMKQISNPGTAMDRDYGAWAPPGWKAPMSMLEGHDPGDEVSAASGEATAAQPGIVEEKSITGARALVEMTKKYASDLAACMAHSGPSGDQPVSSLQALLKRASIPSNTLPPVIVASSGGLSHSSMHSSAHALSRSSTYTASHPAECEQQKQVLQLTYTKAYMEITRLVAEYEVLIHSKACRDYVISTDGSREKTLKETVEKLTTTVTSWTKKLEAYRWRIEKAYRAESALRIQVKHLSLRCRQMDSTVSSLDKVRDAIHVMAICPGLGRITFAIPHWTNVWVKQYFEVNAKTDAELDLEINDLCRSKNQGATARAAETSEIMIHTVEGLPVVNDADVPLIGTCPNCAGDEDGPATRDPIGDLTGAFHASGHARVCWDPGAPLASSGRRTDCGSGRKAVLCVIDSPP